MTSNIQREAALILNYLLLLAAAIFWDLQPVYLLVSMCIEFIVMLLMYLVVSIPMSKSLFSKIISTGGNLLSGMALGLVQAAFLALMLDQIWGLDSLEQVLDERVWILFAIALPLLIFQALSLKGKTFDKDLQGEKMLQMITATVAFPLILLSGLLAYEFSSENDQAALIAIVCARIALEVKNNHFSQKKSVDAGQKKSPTSR